MFVSSILLISFAVLVDKCFSQSLSCNFLECDGMNISEYTQIFCFGELSCNNSVISPISQDSSLHIECLGSHSCMNSIFYNVTSSLFYGPFAMRNSIVYNYNISEVFWAHSYYSTYNSTIYCLNGSDCGMVCAGSNCNNFNMICDDTSTCSPPSKRYTPDLPDLPYYYRDYYIWDAISESDEYQSGSSVHTYCITGN